MNSLWMGEPIEDLPREKLLEIIDYMMRDIAELRSPARIRAYALGSVEMLKRGESSLSRGHQGGEG